MVVILWVVRLEAAILVTVSMEAVGDMGAVTGYITNAAGSRYLIVFQK